MQIAEKERSSRKIGSREETPHYRANCLTVARIPSPKSDEEKTENPEHVGVNQDLGERQKKNQGQQKDDPLAA